MAHPGRIAGVVAATIVAAALIVFYAVDFLAAAPSPVSAAETQRGAHLTLQTVAAFGHNPNPDWVSYLAQDSAGHWHHSTIYKLPAHSLVTVTIYQFDTATGLRNPFFAQVRGTVGNVMKLNGTTEHITNPDDASHTFTVPDFGVSVPLPGVADDAKNQCSAAPCTLDEAHTTITFSFRTPAPGRYRWQCFVPCAASFLLGNGGPMQTIGWMSGYLEVS